MAQENITASQEREGVIKL